MVVVVVEVEEERLFLRRGMEVWRGNVQYSVVMLVCECGCARVQHEMDTYKVWIVRKERRRNKDGFSFRPMNPENQTVLQYSAFLASCTLENSTNWPYRLCSTGTGTVPRTVVVMGRVAPSTYLSSLVSEHPTDTLVIFPQDHFICVHSFDGAVLYRSAPSWWYTRVGGGGNCYCCSCYYTVNLLTHTHTHSLSHSLIHPPSNSRAQ